MNVPNDPNPIHLHLFTSLCSTKSLIACSCVSDAWRANLSWLLKSTAKLPIPLKPWLGTDLISQTQTQAWTRSYTIYEALRRHHLLTPSCTQLCVAVVGTDVVEGDKLLKKFIMVIILQVIVVKQMDLLFLILQQITMLPNVCSVLTITKIATTQSVVYVVL